MLNLITNSTLAWRPFLDPLDLHTQWFYTLIPLAFLVSFTYKAVRLKNIGPSFAKHVIVMTIQIIGAMIALAIASYLLVLVVLPMFY